MIDEIKEKQNFLRKEILDNNLDGEEFYSYLVDFDEEKGDNLELWNMDDLKKIVQSFQLKKSEEKKKTEVDIKENEKGKDKIKNNKNELLKKKLKIEDEKVQSPPDSFFEVDDNEKNEIEKETNINNINNLKEKEKENEKNEIEDNNNKNELNTNLETEKNNISKIDFSFNEKFQGIKVQETELSKIDKINVVFSTPKKHSGSLFSKSYFTYEFCTLPLKYSIIRKYKDFKWLHDIIQSIYTGICVPPIPKNIKMEKINDFIINKNKRSLEKFIQSLVDNDLIKHSPILFDFLSIEDKSQFYSRQTYYSKGKIPKSLNKLYSLDGNIEIKFKNSDLPLLDYICEFNENSQVLLKKITLILSEIYNLFNTTSDKIKEFSFLCSDFDSLFNKFYEKEKKSDLFKNLNNIMNNWSDIMRNQSEFIEINLREQFKFINKQQKEMSYLIKTMNQKKFSFIKYENKLIQKKEELFKKGDVNKWGLKKDDLKNKENFINNKELAFKKMLPKDTLHTYNYKRAFAFFAYSLIKEFDRIRDRNIKIMKENLITISNVFIDDINKMKNNWQNIIDLYDIQKSLIQY